MGYDRTPARRPDRPAARTPSIAFLNNAAATSGGSVVKGLEQLRRQGRLGELAREITQLAAGSSAETAKAAHYDTLAAAVCDPAMAEGYRQLAKRARQANAR